VIGAAEQTTTPNNDVTAWGSSASLSNGDKKNLGIQRDAEAVMQRNARLNRWCSGNPTRQPQEFEVRV
jgi:hypothetical protein